MPQIANQDYNIVRPVVGSSIITDAAALGELVGHASRGTLFDCILEGKIFSDDTLPKTTRVTDASVNPRDDGSFGSARLRFVTKKGQVLDFGYVSLVFRQDVYETFADIQRQSGADAFGVSCDEDGRLVDDYTSNPIAIDGKYIVPQLDDDDIIVAWSLGDEIPDGVTYYSITEQEMNTIIGFAV